LLGCSLIEFDREFDSAAGGGEIGVRLSLFTSLVVRSGDYRLYDIVNFLLVEPLALRHYMKITMTLTRGSA
jgi:hypothetical protein